MNPTVITVLAYEDIAVAKLAKEKWDFMVNSLRAVMIVELRLWKFDALRFPELSEAAVKDAAQAEMIIVATKGAGEFPSEVKTWIEQWLAQKDQKNDVTGMLMFLCDPPQKKLGPHAISQFGYLQQVARKGSMDFLASTPHAEGSSA